jgi:L,D-peptidoglycan transpeptidase YkuD (ErfK/YbiS/YcfS/YnhG family)
VPETWAALSVATVPTNAGDEDEAAAGGRPEVVVTDHLVGGVTGAVAPGAEAGGVSAAVAGAVVAGVGACAWRPPIRGVLEHAVSSPHARRAVVLWMARWRPGRGTVAHHSPVRPRPVMAVVAVAALVVVASCGSGAQRAGAERAAAKPRAHPTTSTIPTTVTTTVSTTAAPTVPPATVTTRVAPSVPPPTATTAPRPAAPPPPAPLLVTRLVGVGSATQVIAVSASGYGQTVATLTAYQQDAAGWHQVFGPWQADVGYAGFAPPGQKREGDGRTPSGSFGFGFFFGVLANPGVQFPYRPVTGPDIVWDDDPASPLYNQWVDTTMSGAGVSPEPMDQTPAYDYGAVIDYNTAPTVPGDGSAIFLHVSGGGPTAGCVSLPTAELLSVLRWLSPAAQPRIIMGTAATISP